MMSVVSRDIASFKSIRNLGEVPLTSETLILASKLRNKYGITYFDSLHAASALLYDRVINRVIISIDKAYRKIPSLKVIDPTEL